MDFKVPLLSPFNYANWNPKMSAYLKRQCLLEVSIGALSEPQSYEENIDCLNKCDRDYGIMCLGSSPNIHHRIDSIEYPFEIWKILEKDFGMQAVEDEAWSKPNISSCDLSQYVFPSTFSDEFIYDE